jgi:hypothetical protein
MRIIGQSGTTDVDYSTASLDVVKRYNTSGIVEIAIIAESTISNRGLELGRYPTLERALKVMEEIRVAHAKYRIRFTLDDVPYSELLDLLFYYMPKE